ncbi:Vacuolar protease A [Blyttiomyces sp. JEL0837]|nr:Vacuolar protease A [Blyttiomyces sp. JEL0837]
MTMTVLVVTLVISLLLTLLVDAATKSLKPTKLILNKSKPNSRAGITDQLNSTLYIGYQLPVTLSTGQLTTAGLATASTVQKGWAMFFSELGVAAFDVSYRSSFSLGSGLTPTIDFGSATQLSYFYPEIYGDGLLSLSNLIGYSIATNNSACLEASFYYKLGVTGDSDGTKLGLYIPSANDTTHQTEITFGGIDTSKYVSKLFSVPVSNYFQPWTFYPGDLAIIISDQTYPFTMQNSVIFDIIYNYVALPDATANTIYTKLGATFDTITGLHTVDCNNYTLLPDISIAIENTIDTPTTLYFNISAYNYVQNVNGTCIVLITPISTYSPQGYLILGVPIFRQYYSVFDFNTNVNDKNPTISFALAGNGPFVTPTKVTSTARSTTRRTYHRTSKTTHSAKFTSSQKVTAT